MVVSLDRVALVGEAKSSYLRLPSRRPARSGATEIEVDFYGATEIEVTKNEEKVEDNPRRSRRGRCRAALSRWRPAWFEAHDAAGPSLERPAVLELLVRGSYVGCRLAGSSGQPRANCWQDDCSAGGRVR